jgi:hypothetical protein
MALVVTTAVQMRFADIDSFGHVNNLAQQAYFDLGKVELFERIVELAGASTRVSVVLVSLHTEFMQQMNCKILGVVLNDINLKTGDYSRYGRKGGKYSYYRRDPAKQDESGK